MGKTNLEKMRWNVDGQGLSLICTPWCLTETQGEQKHPLLRPPSALVLDSNLGSLAMAWNCFIFSSPSPILHYLFPTTILWMLKEHKRILEDTCFLLPFSI